jgi:hypothetical protein
VPPQCVRGREEVDQPLPLPSQGHTCAARALSGREGTVQGREACPRVVHVLPELMPVHGNASLDWRCCPVSIL